MNGSEAVLKRYLYCNRCKTQTNHQCKGEHRRVYSDPGLPEAVEWRLWICAGCEEGTLEETWYVGWQEDPEDEVTWQLLEEPTYHPPRRSSALEEKRFTRLPSKLKAIYAETLRALNNGMAVLSASGIRALIEGICADRKITGRNLQEKIEGMSTILPTNIIEALHSIRFIGNEALHELTAPEPEELSLAFEVCEDLLNFLYELDYKARRLTASGGARRSDTLAARHRTQSADSD